MTILRLLPPNSISPRALILVLHGVGSDAASMQPLSYMLHKANPTAVVIMPDAPFPFDGGGRGYQWFSVRGVTDGNRQARIAEAVPNLEALIEAELARYSLTHYDLGVCGFSQGAMMALAIADTANPPAAIASIAGRITRPVASLRSSDRPSELLLTHGESDQIVPFACLQEAIGAFSGAGYAPKWSAIPHLGHQISNVQAQAVGVFFRSTFQKPPIGHRNAAAVT